MQRLQLTILAALLVLFCVAGDALARGRSYRHYHHRPRTSFHFGISAYLPPFSWSWYAPYYGYYAYPAPYPAPYLAPYPAPYPAPYYGTYAPYKQPAPYRRYGLIIESPLAVWSGLNGVDRVYASTSTYRALEVTRSGEMVAWNNQDTGASGTVSPRPAFKNARGEDCREFQQTVHIGGQARSADGIACRQPDGSWRIVQ
jgi:hypothetical protein